MNNNDERDYAEEAYNRRSLQEGDGNTVQTSVWMEPDGRLQLHVELDGLRVLTVSEQVAAALELSLHMTLQLIQESRQYGPLPVAGTCLHCQHALVLTPEGVPFAADNCPCDRPTGHVLQVEADSRG